MTKIEQKDLQPGIELKVPLHESNSITIKLDGPLFRNSGRKMKQTACKNFQEDAVEDRKSNCEGICSYAARVSCMQRLRAWFCEGNIRAVTGFTTVAVVSFVLGLLITGRQIPLQEDIGAGSQPIEQYAVDSEESIKDDAVRIANGILEGQLTEEKAKELLSALDLLGSMSESTMPGGELPDIPENTLKILEENGLMDAFVQSEGISKNSGQETVRIPEEIMERFQGEDGIASIPDQNYWAMTGDRVNLPLPGGGNVESAEEFKEFGLKF